MSDTNFTDKVTAVVSSWLQDINDVVYRLLGSSAGAGGAAPTTRAEIVSNLGIATSADLAAFEESLADSAGSSLVGFLQSGTGAVATDLQTEVRTLTKVFTTYADARGDSNPPQNNKGYYVLGAAAANDGGGGLFYGVSGASAGTYTDDGGTIIVPTGGDGSAAFVRVFDGHNYDGAWFSIIPDSTGDSDGTDHSTVMQAVVDAVSAKGGGTIYLRPDDTYKYVMAWQQKSGVFVKGMPGVWYEDDTGGLLGTAIRIPNSGGDIISSPASKIQGGGVQSLRIFGVGSGRSGKGLNIGNNAGFIADELKFYNLADEAVVFSGSQCYRYQATRLLADGCLLNTSRTEPHYVMDFGGSDGMVIDTIEAATGLSAISDTPCQFTGSISGTTLTVSAVSSGTLSVGQMITGDNIVGLTTITADTGGGGGTGTYTVSASQTVSSTSMVAAKKYIRAVRLGNASDGTNNLRADNILGEFADVALVVEGSKHNLGSKIRGEFSFAENIIFNASDCDVPHLQSTNGSKAGSGLFDGIYWAATNNICHSQTSVNLTSTVTNWAVRDAGAAGASNKNVHLCVNETQTGHVSASGLVATITGGASVQVLGAPDIVTTINGTTLDFAPYGKLVSTLTTENTSSTTVTATKNVQDGQIYNVICLDSNTTLQQGTYFNLPSASDLTLTANKAYSFLCISKRLWYIGVGP